ncbi:MAG: glutamate--cysteine ligase [Acidimicrobiales bacterium]
MAPEGDDLTVGVEEEFLLVDAESRRLVPAAARVLDGARAAAGARGQVEHELQLAQVETGTEVCRTLGEVRAEVTRLRRAVATAAEAAGCRVASAGTHPMPPGDAVAFTPKASYLRLERDYQQVAREQLVCGCHVHVGVADAEVAVQVLNRALPWLPVVRALAANSPFWMGDDTGYASFRSEIWSRWPTAGTPAPFADRAEYDRVVADLMAVGAVDGPARVYWDVRPSARYDTLEFRVTDACLRVDETVMVAGLLRALVATLAACVADGAEAAAPRPELLRAAAWRAARYGTEGELVDLEAGRSMPAAQVVGRLLALVRPALEAAGEWDEIRAGVERVLAGGTGAARQRQAFARTATLEGVVDLIVAETAPAPRR